MTITGQFTEDELIEYIGLKLKIETIKIIASSEEYSDSDKVKFINLYLQEGTK